MCRASRGGAEWAPVVDKPSMAREFSDACEHVRIAGGSDRGNACGVCSGVRWDVQYGEHQQGQRESDASGEDEVSGAVGMEACLAGRGRRLRPRGTRRGVEQDGAARPCRLSG
ncbi:MAG: hypothetical protein LBE74_04765 [Treponema sp.]|nr:hypothetical protein [Treponema sp.]